MTYYIGKQLKISLFNVRSVIKKLLETGSTENKVRTGQPQIFSAREKHDIIREVYKNPKISVPQLVQLVANTSQKTYSSQTIQNILRESYCYGRAVERKWKIMLDFAKVNIDQPAEF